MRIVADQHANGGNAILSRTIIRSAAAALRGFHYQLAPSEQAWCANANSRAN
jgi:hypothetical protein